MPDVLKSTTASRSSCTLPQNGELSGARREQHRRDALVDLGLAQRLDIAAQRPRFGAADELQHIVGDDLEELAARPQHERRAARRRAALGADQEVEHGHAGDRNEDRQAEQENDEAEATLHGSI